MKYLDVYCYKCKLAYVDEWVEPEWICDECEAEMLGVGVDEL